MKRNRLFKLAPVMAATSALGFGMVGDAHAAAYGLAYNDIYNLSVAPHTGSAGSFVLVNYRATSSDDASLNNAGPTSGTDCVDSTGAGGCPTSGLANAPFSLQGSYPGYINDQIFPTTPGAGPTAQNTSTSYSLGDAGILTDAVSNGDSKTRAANAAEVNLVGSGGGVANGSNSSTTGFTVDFSVFSGPLSLQFDFNANPYLRAMLSSDIKSGSVLDSISVTFTIDQNGTNLFTWSPNGQGSISGGTVTKDQANLQQGKTLTAAGVNSVYDPANGIGAPGSSCSGGVCAFSAFSVDLPEGTGYSLGLSMTEKTTVSNVVPEPSSIALMGIGLAAIGRRFVSQRKKV